MSGEQQSPVALGDDRATWEEAAHRMFGRAWATATTLETGFPHWADARSGTWATTPDGDWTGGALPGMLWVAAHWTGDARIAQNARDWCLRLRPRAALETAFKGFGFYYGASLGDMLVGDPTAAAVALEAAESLRRQFDPRLGLIPLGAAAEEANETGAAFSSIDSLQAVPLLFWAARKTGDAGYARCAADHTTRVLDIHCRADGGIIQSSELNPANGTVLRRFTHKGFGENSVWGRAQAWGMLYAAMAYAREPGQPQWLHRGMEAADWWLDHVPADRVAFWDFDDPAVPHTERDTAATAIACSALLKLAVLAPEPAQRTRYRDAARASARELIRRYLTPLDQADQRPSGMLVGGCFNKRADSRVHDAATNAELIFGSYYLFESLLVLAGVLHADGL